LRSSSLLRLILANCGISIESLLSRDSTRGIWEAGLYICSFDFLNLRGLKNYLSIHCLYSNSRPTLSQEDTIP
jgi:hypothetical protein